MWHLKSPNETFFLYFGQEINQCNHIIFTWLAMAPVFRPWFQKLKGNAFDTKKYTFWSHGYKDKVETFFIVIYFILSFCCLSSSAGTVVLLS